MNLTGISTVAALEYLAVHLPSWTIALPVRAILHNTVYEDLDPFYAIFRSFRVIDLDIKHTAKSGDILFQLTTPNEVDGVKRWCCPELKRLSLECNGTTLPALRAMVEARYESTPNGSDPLASPSTGDLPTPLHSLRVIHAPPNSEPDRQALERIVGQGKVTWEFVSDGDGG